MAYQSADINAILAALDQQNRTPRTQKLSGVAGALPSPTAPALYKAPAAGAGLPAPHSSGSVSLPPPSNSGNFDLSAIKPVNSGNMELNAAIARAQGLAAAAETSACSPRVPVQPTVNITVDRPPSNYRSRSRSPRRDNYADSYNPYRDERRGDNRRGGRDRSMSPGRRNGGSGGGSNGRNNDDNSNSDVISVDSNAVGLIIGRAGENMRRIENTSGARVQFITGPEGAGTKRQCRVSGTVRQRADAIADIFRTQAENHHKQSGDPAPMPPPPSRQSATPANSLPMPRDGEHQSQIMVPDKTVGLIIGRGGETIRDLQDRSRCHVNITNEKASIGGYRPVNLIGTSDAAAIAESMIREIVESDQKAQQQQQSSQSYPPRRNDNPPPPGGNYGPSQYANAPPDPYGTSAPKETEHIHVPSEAVGMIIGKGGETIKEMQNNSGCKINVSQPQGADITRPIELIGSRMAIGHAKRLIDEKVGTVREKQGGGRGGQSQPSQSYGGYGSPNPPGQYSQPPPSMPPPPNNNDPYAVYGGYQNYMNLWAAAREGGYAGQGPPGS